MVQVFPTIRTKRFGVNLYDEPLFRIVWSDSRTDLIGGKWPDGVSEYRECPRYPGVHAWVLEMWKSPEEYAGTRENYEKQQWDPQSGLLTCGPYPHRGEYVMAYTFPFEPNTGMAEKIITALKLSRDLTPSARKEGIFSPLENQEKARSDRFDAQWSEAMGAWSKADAVVPFGRVASTFGRQGFKRAGDMPHPRMDQSSPLPTAPGFFGTIRKEDTIKKLTGE